MNFKKFLQDTDNTFQMYHGGQEWNSIPTEIIQSRKNRYEYGVGIYTTNNYETAARYGKGGRVVQILDIDKNYRDIKDVTIPLFDVINFLNTIRVKNKSKIIEDLRSNANRMKRNDVSANVINNLIVNHQAGAGDAGVQVTKFLTQHGVDALLEHKSGEEYYLIIFNPQIIKQVRKVDPKQINNFILPLNFA
jgi:hypothetical protein